MPTTFFALNINAAYLLLISRYERNTTKHYLVLLEVYHRVFAGFGITFAKFKACCQTAWPAGVTLPRADPNELRMAKRHCGEEVVSPSAPSVVLVATKVVARVMLKLKAEDPALGAALTALHAHGSTNLLQLHPNANALPAALLGAILPESELPPALPACDFSIYPQLQGNSRYGLEATAKERWEHPALQHEVEDLM